MRPLHKPSHSGDAAAGEDVVPVADAAAVLGSDSRREPMGLPVVGDDCLARLDDDGGSVAAPSIRGRDRKTRSALATSQSRPGAS